MSTAPESLKPNRTPWIIAGALGCLVICLLVAILGGGAYFLLGQAKPTQAVFSAPTAAGQTLATVPPVIVPTIAVATLVSPAPLSTQTSAPSATLPLAQSTQASAQPSVAPVAQATQPPAVSPTSTKTAAPTGKIAFSKCEGNCDSDVTKTIWVMDASGANAKKILDRASSPSFSPDGTLIAFFRWTDGIFVAKADGSDAKDAKKIVGDSYTRYLDWSHDGNRIAFTAQPNGSGNVVIDVVPPDGTAVKDLSQRRNLAVGFSPSWSPDDTQLVFSTCRGSDCGVFKGGIAGGDPQLLVGESSGLPDWSPDGKRILYQKKVDNVEQLFVMNADGSGKSQLTQGPSLHVAATWSLDGAYIFYRSPEAGTWGIFRINADGSNKVKLIDNVGPVDFAYERLAVTR